MHGGVPLWLPRWGKPSWKKVQLCLIEGFCIFQSFLLGMWWCFKSTTWSGKRLMTNEKEGGSAAACQQKFCHSKRCEALPKLQLPRCEDPRCLFLIIDHQSFHCFPQIAGEQTKLYWEVIWSKAFLYQLKKIFRKQTQSIYLKETTFASSCTQYIMWG